MKHIFSALTLLLSIHLTFAQTHTISGAVALDNGTGIPNAIVQLTNTSTGDTFDAVTNSSGGYNFINLPAGDNYELSVSKKDDPYNGTSTFDIVLLSKHILQNATIQSSYKILAGDVNQSGAVSTQDIVYLAALILAQRTNFPNDAVWRFIPANYTFPNPANPFTGNIPATSTLNNLNADTTINFVGVKLGDINGNADLTR